MKYGVNTMVWTTRVGEQQQSLLSRIREWGFDGVELFLSPEEPADIPAVRKILDQLKLECTTCSVLPREAHLVSTQGEVRAHGVEFLKRCVERTADLGARLICGPLYAGLGVLPGTDEMSKNGSGRLKVFGLPHAGARSLVLHSASNL